MIATEVLGAVVGAVGAVFGGNDKQQDDGGEPMADAADGGGGTVAVNGATWPRRSDARIAQLATVIAAAEREEGIKLAKLRAAVSDALEARDARLRALHGVDQAARASIRTEIVAELRPKVEAAWHTYRQSAALEDAKTLGAVLVAGAEREHHELGESNFFTLTVGTLASVASGQAQGHHSDIALQRADRAVRAALSGSVLMLMRTLIDLDEVVPNECASRLS